MKMSAVLLMLGVTLAISTSTALADTAPTVTIKPATTVGYTTTHLSGTVNPNGGPSTTSWHFEYATAGEENWTAAAGGEFAGTEAEKKTPQTVETNLEGLTQNVEYQVRLVAGNEGGETHSTEPNPTFKTKEVTKPTITLAAVPPAAKTAHLSGTIDPNGTDPAFDTAYHFECTPECPGLTGGEVPASTSAQTVTAEVTGLVPHTMYMVVLVASNDGGEEVTAEAFTTLAAAPEVEETFVTDISSESATLHAKLNPGGANTTYTFEDAAGNGAFAPVRGPGGEALRGGEGSAGAGITPVTLETHVAGLAANTAYRFRLVATNAVEKGPGETVSFTTQQSEGAFTLPDNRQYEMVTPPEKQGAKIDPIQETGLIKAAASGDALTFVSQAPIESEPVGFGGETVQNLATRGGAGGWSARDLTVPHERETSVAFAGLQEYQFFSEDLSSALVSPLGQFTPCTNAEGRKQPCLSEEASEQTPFLNDLDTRSFTPLVTGKQPYANVPPGTVFGNLQAGTQEVCQPSVHCGPLFIAATPDLSHVVLLSETSLIHGIAAAQGALYEWSAGKLTFIGYNGAFEGSGASLYPAYGPHGISADGSRVIFSGSAGGLGGLLMRDTATGETVRLGEGGFDRANAEDSRVFFTENGELYVWEQTSGPGASLAGTRTPLADGAGIAPSAEGAGTSNVLGASEDGSYVYFVSNGVLTGEEENARGEKATSGHCEGERSPPGATCNLYVDHYDSESKKWTPTFITALSEEDRYDWLYREEVSASQQPTRASPNGQYLAFMSQRSLTGYDNRDAVNGKPDAEVYEYDATANKLVCASCEPTDARPLGVENRTLEESQGGLVGARETWNQTGFVAANLPGWDNISIKLYPEGYQSRYLSDSGRLFFNSDDALVPQDSNGTQDVYEYEPEGLGTCTSATSTGSSTYVPVSTGCVGLISSGDSSEESAFLDASESGGDVFFLTSAKLSSQDKDTAYDIYDAHECTSESPCSSAAETPPPCDTEASCKASPTPQPEIYGLPSSATFSGPGNLAPPPLVPSRPKPKTAAQVRAEKLAAALKTCRKKSKKKARTSCEASARKKYSAKTKAKSKKAKKPSDKGTKGAK
jgi:hypothetical protein